MLCMTFNNSLLTASNCTNSDRREICKWIVSHGHQKTDSLVSVMTMSVCVGWSGLCRKEEAGSRPSEPEPAARAGGEVRAPVASGQVTTSSCDALTFRHPASVISRSRRPGDVTNNICDETRNAVCSQLCFVVDSSLVTVSSDLPPPIALVSRVLTSEMRSTQRAAADTQGPVWSVVQSCVYLPYQVQGLTNLTRLLSNFDWIDTLHYSASVSVQIFDVFALMSKGRL